jgi:hypothetical protein
MKNAATIVSLALILFAIALAVMIGSRLSEQEIALLAGMACGVGIAIPLGAAIGVFAAGQRRRDRDAAPPPIIYMQPQPPSSVPSLPNTYALPPRSFNVIGDSGFEEEK